MLADTKEPDLTPVISALAGNPGHGKVGFAVRYDDCGFGTREQGFVLTFADTENFKGSR